MGEHEALTPLGRMLARIPLAPHLSRMLLVSSMFGVWDPACTTVASVGQRPYLSARTPDARHTHHRLVETALAQYGRYSQLYSDCDPLALHSIIEHNISSERLHFTNFNRILRIRHSLTGLIRNHHNLYNRCNRNAADPTLFRFLLTWACTQGLPTLPIAREAFASPIMRSSTQVVSRWKP